MSEEPDFEARDHWGNPLWYKCHACGHVWKAGQSGSHNCLDLLKPALDAAVARAEKAEREVANLNDELSMLQSECARLEITKSLPLRLWCKAITTAASKDPTVIQHYTSLGGDVIGLEEHRQILAARLERFLRIFERDD